MITQTQLAAYLNQTFGTELSYRAMSVEDYRNQRWTDYFEALRSA